MKIEKTFVEAKSRTLTATYTLEEIQDLTVEMEGDLAKILQEEIDNEFMSALLDSQGWTKITVKRWSNIDTEWCKKYIKGNYKCFGHYWHFEDEKDANFFILKWGTS